jgi:nucleoside-diphosphate-sugar epimerase/glycosyltransferase involved in cell wall biosynthesis
MKPPPGRVLVTGSTGLVGSTVCSFLEERGWIVVRGIQGLSPLPSKGTETLSLGDLGEAGPLCASLRGIDAVIHLAALAHDDAEHASAQRLHMVNTEGTRRLVAKSVEDGVQHFILVSTSKVYGDSSPEGQPFKTASKMSPIGAYATSKQCAEQALWETLGPGTRGTIIRSPLVYGPAVQGNLRSLLVLARSHAPSLSASVGRHRSMVYVGNLASLIEQSLLDKRSFSQTLNVSDGDDVTVGELTMLVRRAMKLRRAHVPVPSAIVNAFARRALPNRIAKRLFYEMRLDTSETSSLLEWLPEFTVRDGLRRSFGDASRTRPILLMVVTEDWYFLSHRSQLAARAHEAGWDVHIATHVVDAAESLNDLPISVHPIEVSRRAGALISHLRLLGQLNSLYRSLDPDVIHHVALVPVVLGGIAAKWQGGMNVVDSIAGLGSTFTEDGGSPRWLERLASTVLKRSLADSRTRVVVQNEDDRQRIAAFTTRKPIPVVLIRGSGIDPDEFNPVAQRANREEPDRFRGVLASRMLWTKGIEIAVEASGILNARGIPFTLLIAGFLDESNPDHIAEDTLNGWVQPGVVEWLGRIGDMPALWRRADLAVVPSYYREGVPRVLLEAAMSGLPSVAADIPGCREAIVPNVTGILVEPRSSSSLADAIEWLYRNPQIRSEMGVRARQHAVAEFSNQIIHEHFLQLYESSLRPSRRSASTPGNVP